MANDKDMKEGPGVDPWKVKVADPQRGRESTRAEKERQQVHYAGELQGRGSEAAATGAEEAVEREPLYRQKEVLGRLAATIITMTEKLDENPAISMSVINGADRILKEAAPRVLSAGDGEVEVALIQAVGELTKDTAKVREEYRPYSVATEDCKMFEMCKDGVDDQMMGEVEEFLLEKLGKVR